MRFLGSEELDLRETDRLERRLDGAARLLPAGAARVLVNTAAFTNVDAAERERETAYLLNARAPGELARWAARQGFLFVHYSTDFVYSGRGDQPWEEIDETSPVNYYGVTKAQGEEAVRAQGGTHLIFRTAWLYGAGTNFPTNILQQARQTDHLRVVADQVGAPTAARDLAQLSRHAIDRVLRNIGGAAGGTYNLVNRGFTSKHAFAEHMLPLFLAAGLISRIPICEAVNSDAFPNGAPRPSNCRLATGRFEHRFGITPPFWRESFAQWVRGLPVSEPT